MGLAAKSSTEGYFFDDFDSTPHFEHFMYQLAKAFLQLAKARLTDKQRLLLLASFEMLRYYPNLSPTALADRLSRKLCMPLSTTKFNLRILKDAGLLETKPSSKWRTSTSLSFGGKLLARLLSEPQPE
jgi:hypothetical protein